MKKWKKWKKGIAGILAGAVFLGSMPAEAQNLFTDEVTEAATAEGFQDEEIAAVGTQQNETALSEEWVEKEDGSEAAALAEDTEQETSAAPEEENTSSAEEPQAQEGNTPSAEEPQMPESEIFESQEETEKEPLVPDSNPEENAPLFEEETKEETSGQEGLSEEEKTEDAEIIFTDGIGDMVGESETPSEQKIQYPIYDSMSIAELFDLDENTVGAATETPGERKMSTFALTPGEGEESTWSFDAYYVGQSDSYDVYKTYDFSLKYQMEFHTDYDLTEPGDVVIAIPRKLLTERSQDGGNPVLPGDIAVPQGGKNSDGTYVAVESRVTPFNYYIDGDNLVFYNYKTIQAGTNAAWQVLYKNVDVSRIVNESTWKLTPKITVTKREPAPEEPENPEAPEAPPTVTTEERETTPLTGKVHTTASLNRVTKDVLKISGKSYSPGLYTRKQVERVLGKPLTGEFAQNFSNYVFVGWKVAVDVNVVQPVTLEFEDTTTYVTEGGTECQGKLVGIDSGERIGYYTEGDAARDKSSRSGIRNIQIVTAYPKAQVKPGVQVKNIFKVKMTLFDDKTVQRGEDDASWVYELYHFKWSGDIYQAYKRGGASYPGWLNVLEQINQEDNENKEEEAKEYLDAFPFTTETVIKGYGLTHYVDGKKPETLGERIPGTYYKVETKDGFYEWEKVVPGESEEADWDVTDGFSLHAYSNTSGKKETLPLNSEDFYIKNLSVRRVDTSYDVWEDEPIHGSEIDTGENQINQDIHVYGAYRQPGKNQEPEWQEITTIAWTQNSNGRTYSISNEELKRDGSYPIAVSTSYKGISYESHCYLSFDVQLRYDSPAVQKLLGSDPSEEKSITVRNTARNDFSYCKADNTMGKWASLYRSRQATVSQVGKDTYSAKTARISSDTINGRILVDYNLTARTGYTIYSRASLNYLRAKNVKDLLFPDLEDPTGKKWIFYDLLPYGMTLDFIKPVTAGRITGRSSNYQDYPQSWDKTGVSVSVDPKADIIDNWKDTGRTMIKFHLAYTGDDPTVYTQSLWMEGWGVSFRARYDWEDIALLEKDANISAFTPEDPALSLVGAQYGNKEVPPDYETDYTPFKKGIRDDSETADPDVKNILYARNRSSDDVVVASTSTIKKLVRADDDLLNDYSTTAVVKPEGTYTYDITVTSGGTATKDLVIYDRLEYAAADRTNRDTMDFENRNSMEQVWTGEFAGLDLTELEEAGIDAKVYYSEKRQAARPRRTNIGQGETDNEEYTTPDEVFNQTKDWTISDDWKKPLSEVKAVAVDLRKTKGGTEYILPAMESIGFKLKMKAPKEADPQKPYTYNNPSYYSCPKNTSRPAEMVVGNSVRVELEQKKKDLEIIKKFKTPEDVPKKFLDQEFEFTVTYPPINQGKENEYYPPFAYQIYTLWKLKDGEWKEIKDGQVRTTDKEGHFFLKDGEKAVFKDVRGGEDLLVTEEESPFWKQEWTDNKGTEQDPRVVECANFYRPVLYIQKKTQAVPEDKKEEVKKHTFAFKVDASYINAQGEEEKQVFDENTVYWLVDAARTDGGIPNKIKEAHFDRDGFLSLHEGETAAVFLDNPRSSYTVTEHLDKSSNGNDWLCKEPQKSGQVSVNGSKVVITNTYRWKELILLKEITHQDAEDVEKVRKDLPFTFEVKEVTEENGEKKEIPVTGKEWLLLNKDVSEPKEGQLPDGTDENETYDVRGTLDEKGRFTCAMANRKIKIKNLEAGKTYVIYEVDYRAENQYPGHITEEQKKLLELYKPVNGGTLEVTMPVYSTGKTGTITNDYQMRPLTVSKQILLSEDPSQKELEASRTRKFQMTVSVNGKPFAKKPYRLFKNGQEIPQESSLETDENGSFWLKDGESAYFKDAGLLGDSFQVTETPDQPPEGSTIKFDQIYPPENGAFTGTLIGEGGKANFINGAGGQLVVMKEYIGGDEKGKEIAEKIPKDPERQKEFAVEAEFVFYDENGDVIKPLLGYNSSNDIKILDMKTGEIKTYWWPSKVRTLTIEPGKMYIIPEYFLEGHTVKKIASYRITEVKNDYGHLYREENTETGQIEETWLHIQQKPKGAITGTVKENPLAKLVNEITTPGWKGGTLIEKRMAIDPETYLPQQVMKDSVLTFCVERYQKETKTWLPAEGISYLQSDRLIYDGNSYNVESGYQVTEGNYGVTASDGRITCVKSEETFAYPVVYFLKDKIYLNLYGDTMADGKEIPDETLRLIEVPELSDIDWGYLTGYGKAGSLSYSMSEKEGTILYNRTGTFPVHIEKAMDTDSDETFTMLLKQVLSQAQEPIEKPEHILKSQAVPGMDYIVYDRETNREITRNQTGKNGEIFLQAGQYARLELPENTRWTVEEQQSMTTSLESLIGNPKDKLTPLSENLMLINQPSQTVQVGTVTYDANGGKFGLDTVAPTVQKISYYMKDGKPASVNGRAISDPKQDDMIFVEWYVKGETEETKFELETYDCQKDITVYAKWRKEPDVKYAVSLYGIQQDTYKNEDGISGTAGLTFGPATGKSYLDTYEAHIKETDEGHCIHWDSWEDIIKNSKENPHIYDKCLKNGCTKSVELVLNDTLKKTTQNMTGDGASILSKSIKNDYKLWNQEMRNTGGWPASRMRATLNGADSLTDRDGVAGSTVLEKGECLLSCFPEKLQKAIVAKKVRSDTIYSDYEKSEINKTNAITFDKLWLFSGTEYFKEKANNVAARPYEGQPYTGAKIYGDSSAIGYIESGAKNFFWLRSISRSNSKTIYRVDNTGTVYAYEQGYSANGISPGFCLP